MAILWTGLGNWSIWKINWQKKCSWFSVRMFVLAQGTGRWWDFLSAAMQIYASLKCLPNYSLSLTLRDWLSQNLPVKIWTQFKKSVLAMYFFSFLTFLFFVLPCSVWDSILAIRNALKSSKDLPCDNFIQKLCWSTYHVIPRNMHKERSILKTDCHSHPHLCASTPPHPPTPPSFKTNLMARFLMLVGCPYPLF